RDHPGAAKIDGAVGGALGGGGEHAVAHVTVAGLEPVGRPPACVGEGGRLGRRGPGRDKRDGQRREQPAHQRDPPGMPAMSMYCMRSVMFRPSAGTAILCASKVGGPMIGWSPLEKAQPSSGMPIGDMLNSPSELASCITTRA